MASAPELKNPFEMIKDWRTRIGARTGITNFSSDSAMRSLMDVVAQEVSLVRESQVNTFYSSQISRATGSDLDTIGQDLGLPRLQPTFASTNAREQNFAFYVDSGTFGDINGGNDITVGTGQELYSDERQNELGVRIKFLTTQAVTLDSASSVGYVSVKAETAGQNYNVGSGVIRNHSFTDYSGSGLKVTNFFAVLNGRSQETDSSYRFRLSKKYDQLASRNDTRLLLSSLQVPGVINLKLIPGYYGIGTTAAVVLGADFEASPSLISSVQSRLDQIAVPGLSVVAVSAVKVSVDLELLIGTTRSLTVAAQRQFETEIRRIAKAYFRGLDLGGTLSLSELETIFKERTSVAIRIGRRLGGVQKVFKKVYLRRETATLSSSEREELTASAVSLEGHEFFDLGTIDFSYE